ncbi:MAG TPA: hypothetical protein VFT72_05985 [Opitutaceae bacterium]|nr:hypothetical protein [Opitutaceae bacterium]
MFRKLALALLSCGLFQTALFAAVKIEELVVGPAPNPSLPSYKISDAGVHYAILTMKGSKSLIVVDGKEGPQFDGLFSTTGDRSLTAQNAVVFSRDGEHYAYLARAGENYIAVLDGKEVFRAPYWISALRYGELKLSPTGKHLTLVAAEQVQGRISLRVVVNGKPGPAFEQISEFVTSADESRWVYLGRKGGASAEEWTAVVDGKEAGNIGFRPVFTSDNRLIMTRGASGSAQPQLVVDGKAVIKSAAISDKIWLAPKNGRYAAAAQVKQGGPLTLFVDGKPVSDAKDPQSVVFSPDGKHYMAACRTPSGSGFVVTDGKVGQSYAGVTNLVFTPDSSKAIYQAYAGSKSFLIVDGAESEGFELMAGQVAALALSQKGARYGYGTLDGMNRNFSAIVDGKNVLQAGRRVIGDSFIFSPDGQHYAFATLPGTRNDDARLMVDGAEVDGIEPAYFLRTQTGLVSYVIFSPDSAHSVFRGYDKKNPSRTGLVIDGQLVPTNSNYIIRIPTFTPDGKHVLWLTRESAPGVRPFYQLYYDGRKGPTFEEGFESYMSAWGMKPDGSLHFLAPSGNAVKRYMVTVSDETSVANMPAEAKAAEAEELAAAEKAKAEAEAAKKKAQEDALAAQAKAKADAQAAAEARAQARADAIAAKQKARADALAAKQKAREDAAAARKK